MERVRDAASLEFGLKVAGALHDERVLTVALIPMPATETLIDEHRLAKRVRKLQGDIEHGVLMAPHRVMKPAEDELAAGITTPFADRMNPLSKNGPDAPQTPRVENIAQGGWIRRTPHIRILHATNAAQSASTIDPRSTMPQRHWATSPGGKTETLPRGQIQIRQRRRSRSRVRTHPQSPTRAPPRRSARNDEPPKGPRDLNSEPTDWNSDGIGPHTPKNPDREQPRKQHRSARQDHPALAHADKRRPPSSARLRREPAPSRQLLIGRSPAYGPSPEPTGTPTIRPRS